MTLNKLSDLNNHLFEQLERLNDVELSDEQLEKEIKRSAAVTKIAKNVIGSANLVLQAEKFRTEYGKKTNLPKMLE